MIPTDIALHPDRLQIHWPDGTTVLTAARLREQCRCAGCVKLRRQGQPVTTAAAVRLTDATPVGGYGLQLHFDDGHDRGIFPWVLLRELAGQDGANKRVSPSVIPAQAQCCPGK
jgi:DUF971 family protein